jgi:hypothetical protein
LFHRCNRCMQNLQRCKLCIDTCNDLQRSETICKVCNGGGCKECNNATKRRVDAEYISLAYAATCCADTALSGLNAFKISTRPNIRWRSDSGRKRQMWGVLVKRYRNIPMSLKATKGPVSKRITFFTGPLRASISCCKTNRADLRRSRLGRVQGRNKMAELRPPCLLLSAEHHLFQD